MDFKDILKTVAPWIGTALGGPLGGMALKAAADALGVSDKTIDAVQAAVLAMTPEQAKEMKIADQAFQAHMIEIGYKNIESLEAIAAADRDSARKMQVENKSFMPAVITAGILSSFVGALIVMFFIPIPTPNRDMIIYMVGQLSGFSGSAIAFWLGTTRQSEDKTRLLAQAAPLTGPAK